MDRSAPFAVCSADRPTLPEGEAAPRPRARLLIAFGGERVPSHALRDACSFAVALGAEPHVLRVVAPGARNELASHLVAVRAQHEARRLISAARHARALCDRALIERLPGPQLIARLGTFVEQVALRAVELQADFIAISPNRKRLAPTVQQLARACNRAILVPRRCGSFMTLLAATDLEEPDTPLLRRAAQLGRHLNAKVVALHAVPSASNGADQPSLERRLLALDGAARSLGGQFESGQFESVVLRTADPAQDIIHQAQRIDADIIFVGTRPHATARARETAARVMRRAQRSVLVTPLTAPAGSERLVPAR
jgi:nucleotide-binding universal stress UspA family protein